MNCGGLSCKELCDFLCDYLEGGLPAPRRETFERHLRECPPCAEYLLTYRKTILAAKQCHGCGCAGHAPPPPPPPPADMIQAVLATLRSEGVCKKTPGAGQR